MGTPACTTRTNWDQPRAGEECDGPKTTNKQKSLHPTTIMTIPPTQLRTSQLHWPLTRHLHCSFMILTFREILGQPLLVMSSSSCSHNLALIMHIDSNSSCRYISSLANIHIEHGVYYYQRFTRKSSPLADVHRWWEMTYEGYNKTGIILAR